jgi:hypothetical protein
VLTALRKLDTEITGQRTHWQDMWMDVSKTPAAGALLRSLQIAEVLKLRCVAMCCDVLRCVALCYSVAMGCPRPRRPRWCRPKWRSSNPTVGSKMISYLQQSSFAKSFKGP